MQPRVTKWLLEQPPPQHLEPLDLSNPLKPKRCKLDLLCLSTKHKFDTMADDNDNDDNQVQLQLGPAQPPNMIHISIGFHDDDQYCVVSIPFTVQPVIYNHRVK